MVTKMNKLFLIQLVLNRPQLGVLIIQKHLADWIWGFVIFYISFSQAPTKRQHNSSEATAFYTTGPYIVMRMRTVTILKFHGG